MRTPPAELQKFNVVAGKVAALSCLAAGAAFPAAWNLAGAQYPAFASYISVGCCLILTALAGITFLKRREEDGVKKYKWFGKPMTRVRRGGWVQSYDLKHERMMQTFEKSNDFIFRSATLISLFIFAISSNIRTEIEYQCLAAACVIALTTLAGFTLFRRRSP